MEQTEGDIGIKIYNAATPQDEATTTALSSLRSAPAGGWKRRAVAKGVQKTLSKTSTLANFLPTGTLLTFEMVIPSVGECSPVSTTMINHVLCLHMLSLAMMSAMVFMAIVFPDHRVTNCVFPGHEKEWRR